MTATTKETTTMKTKTQFAETLEQRIARRDHEAHSLHTAVRVLDEGWDAARTTKAVRS
jgi:hypothetical protein